MRGSTENSRCLPIDGGVFVGVVGPSGAGKDAVIGFARRLLDGDPRFRFVRRVITRPADPDGEDHLPASRSEFETMRSGGRFALAWQAHGKQYGIPADVDATIAHGGVAVANLSRTVLGDMAARYRRSAIVEITADACILAGRLAARGRESASDVGRRLSRRVEVAFPSAPVVVDNSGPLEHAGHAFATLLARQLDLAGAEAG